MPRTIGLIEMWRPFKNCINEGVVLQQDGGFRYSLCRVYPHRPEFRKALSKCLNRSPRMGLFSASMDCGYMLLCFEIKKQLKISYYLNSLSSQNAVRESILSSSSECFVHFSTCCHLSPFFADWDVFVSIFFKCLQIKQHSNVIKYMYQGGASEVDHLKFLTF